MFYARLLAVEYFLSQRLLRSETAQRQSRQSYFKTFNSYRIRFLCQDFKIQNAQKITNIHIYFNVAVIKLM